MESNSQETMHERIKSLEGSTMEDAIEFMHMMLQKPAAK
jgi:hypothetical protein